MTQNNDDEVYSPHPFLPLSSKGSAHPAHFIKVRISSALISSIRLPINPHSTVKFPNIQPHIGSVSVDSLQCHRAENTRTRDLRTRRSVLQGSSGLLISTFCAPPLWELGSPKAFAEEESLTTDNKQVAREVSPGGLESADCSTLPITKKVFLDIAVDGESAGRIVIGLYGNDAPAGAARFADLASGRPGAGYRKKEFVKITPSYIQNAGIRSYGVDAEIANGKRLLAGELIDEARGLEKKCGGIRVVRGAVGIVIRDPAKPPSQMKLVARQGKIEVKEEEARPDPNGTEFVIAAKNAPELDPSTLVVGRVLSGMEVVDRLTRVRVVQENTKSPYFQVAKLIGDKRAVVAERGFNRPYSKIVITKCGELESL